MLSWNPGKHRTAAKHPIAFNVAVWNFWKRKSKQTSAIWTVNPIRNKAKGEMLVDSSGYSVHSLPSGLLSNVAVSFS